MKKKVTMISIILVSIFIGVLVSINFKKENISFEEKESSSNNSEQIVGENTLSMMLETSYESGNYKMTTQSSWPTEGYIFNATLSKCENGSELSWDDEKKIVSMTGNMSDRCYVYFDVAPPYHIRCNDNTLACYVAKKYTGTQGENNMYYHDGTIISNSEFVSGPYNYNDETEDYDGTTYPAGTVLDAGDNSYRYAGGNYGLTSLANDAGLTVLYAGEKNYETATNGVINFYCNGSKYYISGGCVSKYTQYFTLQYDSTNTQYSSFDEALNKAVSDGYIINNNIKNFVCFGSDETTCLTDNLYRIIGVFDGKIKLIKYDYATKVQLGTDEAYDRYDEETRYHLNYIGSQTEVPRYNWNNDTFTNTWSESNLNAINLNTYYISYLNGINTKWVNMIATATWKAGGNTWKNIVEVMPSVAYHNEIVSPASSVTVTAKIGLMYVSDYEFAASPLCWTYPGFFYYSASDFTDAIASDWVHMSFSEWTISRDSETTNRVFAVNQRGFINDWAGYSSATGYSTAIRPVFYLNSSVSYVSGTGTSTDPFRIN